MFDQKSYLKQYYKERRQKISEQKKERWRSDSEYRNRAVKKMRDDYANNLPKHLYWKAKTRAKKKGLEFSITQEDITVPDICPLLGIAIFRSPHGRTGPNSPSVDRIDSTKGYIKGNVWVISWRANAIKNDASPAELRQIADALEKRLKG